MEISAKTNELNQQGLERERKAVPSEAQTTQVGIDLRSRITRHPRVGCDARQSPGPAQCERELGRCAEYSGPTAFRSTPGLARMGRALRRRPGPYSGKPTPASGFRQNTTRRDYPGADENWDASSIRRFQGMSSLKCTLYILSGMYKRGQAMVLILSR
jgi:hypothetical protein